MRNHKFAQIPKDVIDDTQVLDKPVEKVVYSVLCSYANNETRASWPSVSSIAEKSLCGEKTARRALAKLKAVGLISVKPTYSDDGGQGTNVYVLNEVPAIFGTGGQNGEGGVDKNGMEGWSGMTDELY